MRSIYMPFFLLFFFFFNDTATTEIYTVYNTLSRHDALPIPLDEAKTYEMLARGDAIGVFQFESRSEEHTSELQSLYTISYVVFCLKKKKPYLHSTDSAHRPSKVSDHGTIAIP